MNSEQPLIQKAFELAHSSDCQSVSEIAKAMVDEGYDLVFQHLHSPTLNKQLRQAIQKRSGQK